LFFLTIFEKTHGASTRAPSAGHPPPQGSRPRAGFAAIYNGLNEFTKVEGRTLTKKQLQKRHPKKGVCVSGLQRIGHNTNPDRQHIFRKWPFRLDEKAISEKKQAA
jgi:hypothetical protein